MPLCILRFQAWYWTVLIETLRDNRTLVPNTFLQRQIIVFTMSHSAKREGDSFLLYYFAVAVAYLFSSLLIEHIYRYQQRFPEQYI